MLILLGVDLGPSPKAPKLASRRSQMFALPKSSDACSAKFCTTVISCRMHDRLVIVCQHNAATVNPLIENTEKIADNCQTYNAPCRPSSRHTFSFSSCKILGLLIHFCRPTSVFMQFSSFCKLFSFKCCYSYLQ